jgi:dihydroorotate dehydrogenase electron transfer subunit
MKHPDHRGSILLEDAELLEQQAWPGDQFTMVLRAPRIAARAAPGAFVHLTCEPQRPMRRPVSILRADVEAGTVEILYKVVGPGLRALSAQAAGARISLLGPIGNGFTAHADRPRTVLLGGGVGMPPMVFLAERLARDADQPWLPIAFLGSELPFPFRPRPSTILVPGVPAGTIAAMPLLEALGVPSRLATLSGFPGCFDGYVTGLAAAWLGALTDAERAEVEIFACGPTPMLEATARLAERFGVPCQVSLEEFMACAVGGCAGCAVQLATADGPVMKRVCVDGPVFDARAVFPPAAH